jgi:Flagellar biosynthesis pathway, component FlhB
MDETAAQLRHFAQEASVPIIGNPPVARALYKVGIDEPIPEELFDTVAAILRWVESIGAQERMRAAKNASRRGVNQAAP